METFGNNQQHLLDKTTAENAYVPSDRANDAEYEDVLTNISQLLCNSYDNTMVVIGGDFNRVTSFARSTESRTIKLKYYLLHENFKCCIEHILS